MYLEISSVTTENQSVFCGLKIELLSGYNTLDPAKTSWHFFWHSA